MDLGFLCVVGMGWAGWWGGVSYYVKIYLKIEGKRELPKRYVGWTGTTVLFERLYLLRNNQIRNRGIKGYYIPLLCLMQKIDWRKFEI